MSLSEDDISEDDISEDDISEDDISEDDISEDDISEDDYSEDDSTEDEILSTYRTEQFSKLFHELEHCREDEQMQKIEEMNGLINEMTEGDIETVFTEELFNKIHQMIEEKTLSLESAILLLKNVGYCKVLKKFFSYSFDYSLLSKKMPGMIIEEERRIEDKNERLLVDLCECFALLNFYFISDEYRSIIVPPLLKAASKKEGNEETQKEAEIALLAFSHISQFCEIKKELYLNEIKAIIRYHQEHHNLTRLAYQSAWQFLIYRLIRDKSLERVIMNELHFAREARRELEDLSKCVDWKRKEERGKEAKEALVIWRWLPEIIKLISSCELWNEELVGLFCSIVQVFQASRDDYPDISHVCIISLRNAAEKRNVKIDDLLKSGAIGLFLEEMKQSTLEGKIMYDCLYFYLSISERLKEKNKDEKEESKRKSIKRKMFEWIEEEGYEDIMTSFHAILPDLADKSKFLRLSKYSSDYLWSR